MAHATVRLEPATKIGLPSKVRRGLTILAWSGIVVLAAGFVLKYVFHYYLNYTPAAFDVYWARRGGLFLHISGGMLALLTAPWQFFSGLRRRYMNVHRWVGRVFLVGVACGVAGAVYLVATTTFGWAFGFGLLGLASAWITTTAVAWYAILNRQIDLHKEWMIRAYVVTFAFVTFRVFSDYGPTSRLQPTHDLEVTLAWCSWVVPLAITEFILQFRKLRAGILKARAAKLRA